MFGNSKPKDRANEVQFNPSSNIPESNVQDAIQYVMDNTGITAPSDAAPEDAQYIVASSNAVLTAERVATNGALISWDFGTPGQASLTWSHLGIESLSDPGADRLMAWDDSAGATAWFQIGRNLGIAGGGTMVSVVDNNLNAIDTTSLGAASADKITYFTSDTAAAYTPLTGFARTLLDDANATTARATLGLDVLTNIADIDAGTVDDGDVLVWNAANNAWEGNALLGAGTGTTDAPYYVTTSHAASTAEVVVPAYIQTLLDDTTQGEAQTTLGLVPGTDVQAYDAGLQSIAGLTTAADRMIYTTAGDTYAVTPLTAFARSILDDADEATFKATVNLEIGTDVQAHSSILDATTASFTTADETKLDYITVTQAVDLDSIETRVNDLDAAVILRGTWDASSGSFPGGGTAQAGDSYIVSVGGTVDSVPFTADDRIIAITDNASTTTYAANWHKADYSDLVQSVVGQTGAVSAGDIEAAVNHDNLVGFVADEHIAHSGVTLTAGAGLTGGGDISASRSFAVGAGTGITVNADDVATSASQTHVTALGTIGTGVWEATDVAVAHGGTGASTAADARTNLGLAIGTDVQAYDADLAAIAGITGTRGDVLYYGASGWAALGTGTAGQVLTAGGAGADPSWTSSGAGDVSKVGTPASTQIGVWTGDGTIRGYGAFTYAEGGSTSTLTVGSDDSLNGVLTLAGGTTGTPEGAEITLGTAADHDATYAHYRLDVYEDDFRIGRQGQTDFTVNASGNVVIANTLSVSGGFSGAGTTNVRTATITYVIDGGGSAITTGIKGDLEIPFACTIQQVTMLADQSGSIVVDIWKDSYANFPPTDADSITSSAVPTISAATKSVDSTLTGWTTSITAGDILRFNVDSVSTIQRVTISLEVLKT